MGVEGGESRVESGDGWAVAAGEAGGGAGLESGPSNGALKADGSAAKAIANAAKGRMVAFMN